MYHNFKKLLLVRKSEFKFAIIVQIASFLLGIVLFFFLHGYHVLGDLFELGTMVSISMVSWTAVLYAIVSFTINFNVAISMGRSRKSIFADYTFTSLLLTAQILLVTFLFSLLEKITYQVLFPAENFQLLLYSKLSLLMAVLYVISMIVLPMFFGMMILRYGYKVFWILWAIWLFGGKLLSRLMERGLGIPIFNSIGWNRVQIYEMLWGIVLLIMYFVVIRMIKKQEYTG